MHYSGVTVFSVYEVRARLVPALVCSVPFLAFGYFFLASIDNGFTQLVLAQVLGGISTMAAVFLLLAFAARHVGTWLQDVMFNDGDRFPTTLLLLEGDATFSEERKQQIRAKVDKEFNIDLTDRTSDTAQSRQRVGEAVSHIRKKFFGKKGLALQRNIEFGIAKNVAGGSILAFIVSIIIAVISFIVGMTGLFSLGIILTALYAIGIVFGVMAMGTNSKRYATALFEEYLAD